MSKEIRVYVLSADVDLPFNVSAYDIRDWSEWTSLPENAAKFIDECERQGSVYSLIGFQNACNIEEVTLNNTWIFITDKY